MTMRVSDGIALGRAVFDMVATDGRAPGTETAPSFAGVGDGVKAGVGVAVIVGVGTGATCAPTVLVRGSIHAPKPTANVTTISLNNIRISLRIFNLHFIVSTLSREVAYEGAISGRWAKQRVRVNVFAMPITFRIGHGPDRKMQMAGAGGDVPRVADITNDLAL